MTIKQLQVAQSHFNNNFATIYKELLQNCYNKKFICEEALISEEAEKLLSNYFLIAERTGDKEISEYCIALLKVKIDYKPINQISNDIIKILENEQDKNQIFEIYKIHYGKGTRLSDYNKALSLLI